jgi:26S proteasome regulatory subunit N7
MAPFLAQLLADPAVAPRLPSDAQSLLEKLREKNTQELKKLDEKLEDAEKNLGETEISDALRARASYLAKIGEKVSYLVCELEAFRRYLTCSWLGESIRGV